MTRLLAVAGLGLVAVGTVLLLTQADVLEARDLRALAGESATVDDFGPRGSLVLRGSCAGRRRHG